MRRFLSTYFWHRAPSLTWGLIVRANRERVIPVRLTQIIGGKSWSISLMRMGDTMPIEEWRRTSPRYRHLNEEPGMDSDGTKQRT